MMHSPSDQAPLAAVTAQEGRTDPTALPGKKELRILLVEDSARLRDRLIEILNEPGHMQVTATAATEAQAINAIDTAEFDVLLVDVELQQGSGVGAIRHARSTLPLERQPLIIVLTNFPRQAVRERCMAAGANYFLDKISQFQEVKPLIAGAPGLPPRK